jgi:hypothetical protein
MAPAFDNTRQATQWCSLRRDPTSSPQVRTHIRERPASFSVVQEENRVVVKNDTEAEERAAEAPSELPSDCLVKTLVRKNKRVTFVRIVFLLCTFGIFTVFFQGFGSRPFRS